MKQFIEAGKIVNTHGVRGEVKIQPWADSPEFLCGFKTLYIDDRPVKILSAKAHKTNVIALLEGVVGVDDAIRLKNKTVSINRDDAALEDGAHFITDLIGLAAVDEDTGRTLGTITDILPLTPNNVYVITGTREILVPAVPEFVKHIDTGAGRVTFRLIEGM
ncbi:16S rRNA processing protein RimM [Sporobacter termitidis DSM 10068]|uniref:Ribosome maturation factor RimM n=1 Tax=Sporobacter termitidis DSM 10068 TaxID=1123282 RepID=A0A1M5TRK4_9FIRM|nr:ribosome maturation factor RimM [Sporobacter termitidis]SHH53311.1 16S rRNA processing protein RimM [Sporobacter termitidis DSM 10068]